MHPNWQDQIGGGAGGVKYAVSPPGLRPDLAVYQLDPWLFEDPEAVGRYTLFYTGATRLARNILEEVVDGYNSMNPASLFTVRRIGALADIRCVPQRHRALRGTHRQPPGTPSPCATLTAWRGWCGRAGKRTS